MQRLIQRTASAERNVARKTAKQKDHVRSGESWQRTQLRQQQSRDLGRRIKESRQNRRIDWEAGPLAPRRDVGDKANTYGAMSMESYSPAELEPHQRLKWMHIAEADRVVVIKGREKGRIGKVRDVKDEQGVVMIEGVNVVDLIVPDWMNREDNTNSEIVAQPQPIPIADVRLVYPLPDPATGIPRDVVIDRLMPINRHYDKQRKEWDEGDRVIVGTNTVIPWPEKVEPEYDTHEYDTRRIMVEDPTFRHVLLSSPMPMSVIDELRNKYSKFRTRHDSEFLDKVDQGEAKMEQKKELIKGMRTPLQELADLRERQKMAQDKELSEEQLARIGEVIAAERAKVVQAVSAMGEQ